MAGAQILAKTACRAARQATEPQSELTATTPTTHDTRRLVWLDRQLDPLTEAASYEPQIAAN